MMAYKTLGEVANYINGRAFKPTEWESNGLPIIRIQNLNNPSAEYNYTQHKYDEKFLVRSGDLLFAWSASLGAFIWHGSDAWLNQHIFKVVPHEMIDKKYLYYFLLQVIDELYSKTHGSGMVHITITPFKATPIALPPLPEQHRIVARIESLFEKLDHARELVQAALDSFETRKAAILHKAFNGELTAKWREKNGVKLESWEYKQLEEVCISIYDGDHMAPPKREFGIPFLVISNINKGYVTFEETRFVPEDYYNSLSETRTPQEGDLLYSIVGSFGIPAIVKENIKFCFQRHIALLRPDTKYLNYKCFWYIMQTQEIFNQVDSIATGTAQRTVPIRGLRKISFSFPSLLEQQEIVRTLDSLLEKEQHAKDKLEPILDQIDLMKKSILARAFRGELGTNDPSEENAIELLKAML